MLVLRISSTASPLRRVRGFSLTELLVVITIAAMLMMAIAPGISDWMRNVQVRSTAESIASGVGEARMEAVRRNQAVSFWLVNSPGVLGALDATCVRSSSAASWIVSYDDPSGRCDVATSTTNAPRTVASKSAGKAGEAVTVSALDANSVAANAVTFNGFGQSVAGAGGTPIATIDVTAATGSGGRHLRIAISTAGDVRMCDRDVGPSDPRACR